MRIVDSIYKVDKEAQWVIVQDLCDEDMIRKLAETGRICEVMGHCWEDYTYTYLDYRPDVIGDQRCRLCGKTRERIAKWSDE